MLLVALSLYDIFAVLTPYGPLKALVELSQVRRCRSSSKLNPKLNPKLNLLFAQDRGDAIPGLVYSGARSLEAIHLLSTSPPYTIHPALCPPPT